MWRKIVGFGLVVFLFAWIIPGAGCSSSSSNKSDMKAKEVALETVDVIKKLGPRIHSIGVKNVLVFEKGERLLIPIEGRGFRDGKALGVSIQGIGQLADPNDYEIVHTKNKGQQASPLKEHITCFIELKEEFIEGCETGDPLIVTVTVQDEKKSSVRRSLASGSRAFVLYSASDYRKYFVKTRIGYHEFSAFPLPAKEAANMFGALINDLYYIVRLSMDNMSKNDRLVSTGMIKAYGRVIVNPPQKDETLYTIPVMISPQSREHIYAIITDTKPKLPREGFFRLLEFTGALATSITIGFDLSEEIARSVGIFTGIGIPEGKKLWPDPVPAYLKNVVNFATPDLVKIPSKGGSLPTYLFFSKKELQAIIGDAGIFERNGPGGATEKDIFGNNKKGILDYNQGYDQPSVQVVYLAFDSLDIPFQVIADAE